jgi:hypothetical protein
MGVTYSRSTTGTGMPFKERFRTRPVWACLQTLSLKLKFPVSLQTAAEATQINLLCVFWSLFLTDAGDSITNARLIQERFCAKHARQAITFLAPDGPDRTSAK